MSALTRETWMTGLARFSQVLWIFAGFNALMKGKAPVLGLGFYLLQIAVAAVGVGLLALLPIPRQGWGKIWYWGWIILGILPLSAAVIFGAYLGFSGHEGRDRAVIAMVGELLEALIALALGSGLTEILRGKRAGKRLDVLQATATGGNMNEKQRTILAIAVPVLIIVVALGLASNVGRGYGWDNWEYTWWVWALAVIIISGFEWFMFKR